MIDIGCGTGFYDELLLDSFEKILAIDVSEDMIGFAKKNHKKDNINYTVRNICEWKESCNAGCVISLSHVVGYQLTNVQLRKYSENISKKLFSGRIFLFNFYNLSGLIFNSLMARRVNKEANTYNITRLSCASIDYLDDCLVLDYYYLVEVANKIKESYEIHEKMRFFSMCEIEYMLFSAGFESVEFFP